MLCISAAYAVVHGVSVSVHSSRCLAMFAYSVEMSMHILKLFSPYMVYTHLSSCYTKPYGNILVETP